MSPELKQFYKDIQAWIDAGYPADSTFSEYHGLCGNLELWCFRNYEDPEDPEDSRYRLTEEMTNQFKNAGLRLGTPFNKGIGHFVTERNGHNLYNNEKRLAWIRKHAK